MRARWWVFVVLGALASAPLGLSFQEPTELTVWVQREYNTWGNPLQSEFTVNDKLVNIFTSDTMESLGAAIKPGWNTVSIKTTPQEPAKSNNGLRFRIGPTHKDEKNANRVVMAPVLWEFRNDTDWKLNNSVYSHPLGPGVKEVTHTYRLYYAGLESEQRELKAGDYVLQGKPKYNTWDSPVVATVFVNGTALNTFTLAERQIVITSLLKPGKNEIKIVSGRVPNVIRNNDIEFRIAGPAEWEVGSARFVLTPIVQFNAMQGWQRNEKTGQLVNPLKADADTIERVVPFVMKPPAQ